VDDKQSWRDGGGGSRAHAAAAARKVSCNGAEL
jgi:hypothetical protein